MDTVVRPQVLLIRGAARRWRVVNSTRFVGQVAESGATGQGEGKAGAESRYSQAALLGTGHGEVLLCQVLDRGKPQVWGPTAGPPAVSWADSANVCANHPIACTSDSNAGN